MKRLRSQRHLLELQDVPSDPKAHHGKQTELESADLLLKALADLTERERAAFLLTVHLGLNSSEAGEALGCSAGTVRALSRRAREKLQPSIERLRTWETHNGQERPAD